MQISINIIHVFFIISEILICLAVTGGQGVLHLEGAPHDGENLQEGPRNNQFGKQLLVQKDINPFFLQYN